MGKYLDAIKSLPMPARFRNVCLTNDFSFQVLNNRNQVFEFKTVCPSDSNPEKRCTIEFIANPSADRTLDAIRRWDFYDGTADSFYSGVICERHF